MTIQFLHEGNELIFQEIAVRKYRGPLLAGSVVRESKSWIGEITVQALEAAQFGISYRMFQVFKKIRLSFKEPSGLRLEALLTGEVALTGNGIEITLSAGQYHLTNLPFFTALFKQNTASHVFITYYSDELLERLGITVTPTHPQRMPEMMANLIQELLHNPYEESLRNFYYENSVRELLFFHLSQSKESVQGELTDADLLAIYEADAIIASNLHQHFTIEKLSRMAGTNQFKLKKGFRQLFGMGVFHRLLHKRMEQAKLLLQTTNKSIGEVAALAGYDTAAGFIHAFRKRFGMTPREWRAQWTKH